MIPATLTGIEYSVARRWLRHCSTVTRRTGSKDDVTRHLAPSTLQQTEAALLTTYAAAVRLGLIATNPVEFFRESATDEPTHEMQFDSGFTQQRNYRRIAKVQEKHIVTLTMKDRTKLRHAKRPRDKALWTLMLDSGPRANEALSLTLDTYFPEQNRAYVVGKGLDGERRLIPVANDAVEAIDAYLEWLASKGVTLARSEPIFRSIKAPYEPLTYIGLWKALRRALGKANVHPHALRHTAATEMLNLQSNHAKKRVLWVQFILGHKAQTPLVAISTSRVTKSLPRTSPPASLLAPPQARSSGRRTDERPKNYSRRSETKELKMSDIELAVASVDEIVEHYLDTNRRWHSKSRRWQVRRGLETILQPLETQSGTTWQQRWYSAGPQNEAKWYAHFDWKSENDASLRTIRPGICAAMKLLVRDGVIRPGLGLLLNPAFASIVLPYVYEAHKDEIARVIAGASEATKITTAYATRMRNSCAAMIVFTGKPLSRITVDEWVAVECYRRDSAADFRKWEAAAANTTNPPPRPPFAWPYTRMLPLSSAYTGALAAGLTQPRPERPGQSSLPPTLDRAIAPAATLENVLAVNGRGLPPRVRALIYDTYTLDGTALDVVTIRGHINSINTFFAAVHTLIPGHDSLTIPIEHREPLMNLLKKNRLGQARRPGLQRTSLGTFLGSVRSIYKMTNSVVRRFELTEHLATLGTFPWSDATVKKQCKVDRSRRRSVLHVEVRTHIAHLPGLLLAARNLKERTDALLAAARQCEPGGTFTHDGTTYERTMSKGNSAQQGTGVPLLNIRVAGTFKTAVIDIEARAYKAVQAHALTVLLRETGLRIEEVSELTIENVNQFLAGDTPIPSISVNPSKMDRSRVIGLMPDALRAIHELITRGRQRFGSDPLVKRTDWHERNDQEVAHLIFFIPSRRTFVGPSRRTLAEMLQRVVDHYNEHFEPTVPLPKITPHQMRRLFATDLAERGADVIAIQQALGHRCLSTTSIYIHADEEMAINEMIEARTEPEHTPTATRALAAAEPDTPTPNITATTSSRPPTRTPTRETPVSTHCGHPETKGQRTRPHKPTRNRPTATPSGLFAPPKPRSS